MPYKSHGYDHYDKLISSEEMDTLKAQLPSDNVVVIEKLFDEMLSPDITKEQLNTLIQDLNTYLTTMAELSKPLQVRLNALNSSNTAMKRLHMEELFLDRIQESHRDEEPMVRGFPLAIGLENDAPVTEKAHVAPPVSETIAPVPESATVRSEPKAPSKLAVDIDIDNDNVPTVPEDNVFSLDLKESPVDAAVTIVDKTVPVKKELPVVDTVSKPVETPVKELPVEADRSVEDTAPDSLEMPEETPLDIEPVPDAEVRDEEAISKQRKERSSRIQEYIQKDRMGASQINVTEGADYNAITEADEF